MIVTIEEATLDADGVLLVTGWAAGATAVDTVEVLVAKLRLGAAEYGRPRPDIAAQHPEWVNAASSGFAFAAKLSAEGEYAQEAYVVVREQGGAVHAAMRHIARTGVSATDLRNDNLLFSCDSLTLFDDGSVEIVGWAAHADVVERIEVSLDGVDLGAARTGLDRTDVGRFHSAIPSTSKSGFDFRKTLENLADGEHKVVLTVTTGAGDIFVRKLKAATQLAHESSRRAERGDIRLVIDSPAIAHGALVLPVRNMLSIEGWSVARKGIAAIDLFLDGLPAGAASRGGRRLDIGAAYPDWPEASSSGYSILLPRKVFTKPKQVLRIAARDTRGGVKELTLQVTVDPLDTDDDSLQLRSFVSQAEIDLKIALISAGAVRPRFVVFIAAREADSANSLESTLESLRAQAYLDFRAGFIAPSAAAAKEASAVAERTGVPLAIFADDIDLSEAIANAVVGAPYFMCLLAGDRLGADALLEFALEIATRPEEDFIYADDRRPEAGRDGRTAAFLKPEWSPDLLWSMNYVGRAWCASAATARRAGVRLAQIRERGGYDLVLRLTEAAQEIGRTPSILAETIPASDDAARETAALRAALMRRGVDGQVLPGGAPSVHRVRRRLKDAGLVSIIIPTIASGGLIETCLSSIRRLTRYKRFEIVCVDNIPEADSPWKEWLKQNADCVVEYAAPFNWSKLNNLGAEAAFGEYLLFLNDDIEAIDPDWLDALMEHAERNEVGVVAPRLVYPDRRVQHAGMFLIDRNARHAFRFTQEDEIGPFGLAACERNVAAVTGACMLMRRDLFNAVGGFDESHAIVNNDVDMCLRLWREGKRVVYTPHATLVHHEMASRSELHDVFDEAGFDAVWRNTFASGDPFFHPGLSRDDAHYAPELEATRVIVAGRPLLARENVRRILVQKLDHVGDFVTGLPAIQRLKQRFPAAEIHVLAPSASRALAQCEPAIDSVIEFNFYHDVSQQGLLDIDDEMWRDLEARLRGHRFDIAIDLRKHTDTRDVLKHSGARLLAGFDVRNAFPWLDIALEWDTDLQYLPKRSQVADDYIALVEAVSVACERGRTFLAGPAREEAITALRALPGLANLRPGLFDRPIVGVHAAAGNVLRQWPAEHFAQLIDLIVEAFDVHVALTGSPSEQAIADDVLAGARARERVWSLVGCTSVGELPTLLRAVRLFVGNNSGPHHIAAAVGTPTVGVHSGVVSAREWGPLGPMAVAVQREMSCGPCYLDKPARCPRGLACLQGLRPADVFRVCEQMLGPGLRYRGG